MLENFIPGEQPILLAGDINIDIFKDKDFTGFGPEKELYDTILADGFYDAYSEGTSDPLTDLCEDEDFPEVQCTVGTTTLDAFDPGNASRIDYIFRDGFGTTAAAEVFFNPGVPPPGARQ